MPEPGALSPTRRGFAQLSPSIWGAAATAVLGGPTAVASLAARLSGEFEFGTEFERPGLLHAVATVPFVPKRTKAMAYRQLLVAIKRSRSTAVISSPDGQLWQSHLELAAKHNLPRSSVRQLCESGLIPSKRILTGATTEFLARFQDVEPFIASFRGRVTARGAASFLRISEPGLKDLIAAGHLRPDTGRRLVLAGKGVRFSVLELDKLLGKLYREVGRPFKGENACSLWEVTEGHISWSQAMIAILEHRVEVLVNPHVGSGRDWPRRLFVERGSNFIGVVEEMVDAAALALGSEDYVDREEAASLLGVDTPVLAQLVAEGYLTRYSVSTPYTHDSPRFRRPELLEFSATYIFARELMRVSQLSSFHQVREVLDQEGIHPYSRPSFEDQFYLRSEMGSLDLTPHPKFDFP